MGCDMKEHVICLVCRKTFTYITGRGRTPKYCGTNCRRKAYVKRHPERVRQAQRKWRLNA